MIHIKYKIWFTLKVEIEDATGDTMEKCRLEPTPICRQWLSRQRILVKQQPGMLTHLIEVQADGPDADKPLYTPLPDASFRYTLHDISGSLQAATNMDTLNLTPYLLYLSNNAANSVGSNLYMHRNGAVATTDDRVFRGMFPDAGGGALAVADVFQTQLVSADYRLRDGTGKCREPVFIIRLAKHP